nr:hypothetical protein [Burkholderia diffusa]
MGNRIVRQVRHTTLLEIARSMLQLYLADGTAAEPATKDSK